MNIDKLKCPQCGMMIRLSDALAAELEETASSKAQALIDAERAKMAVENNRLIEDEKRRTRDLIEKAKKDSESHTKEQLKDLEDQLLEQKTALEKSHEVELDLRRAQRKLDEERRAFELTINRKLDEERAAIIDRTKADTIEAHRYKDLEKDKKLADMLAQIEDLKRKAEQSSQQGQGEVLELELERSLQVAFPQDTISPVAKGVKGGDIIQDTGSGIIMWELKRTKTFSSAWLPKAREDARTAKASLIVLVTETLPKDMSGFGCVEGVWVVSIPLAVALAGALRLALLAEAKALTVKAGKQTKAEEIYDYLTGNEFRNRVSAIVESFVTMRTELESEKRAMNNVWAKREKQLERVAVQLSGMHGDLAGIVGSSLPSVQVLQLEVGA